MYKHTPRKGKHLGLVLQTSEGSRENQPVVVALKLRPVIMTLTVTLLLSQAFVGYKLFPVHHHNCKSSAFSAKMPYFKEKNMDFRRLLSNFAVDLISVAYSHLHPKEL